MDPIQVARYHDSDDEVVQLLIKKTKEKLGTEELYVEADQASLKATEQISTCDSCHIVSIIPSICFRNDRLC